jgi:hypothetical protein
MQCERLEYTLALQLALSTVNNLLSSAKTSWFCYRAAQHHGDKEERAKKL